MTTQQIEQWLTKQGNGIGVSYWNGSYDVTCMTGELKGGARTILGAGNTIAEAIRGAEKRIAELAVKYRVTPQQHAYKLSQ